MRIIVNDLAASTSGALSVLKSFYRYIRNNDNENEYIFLLSEKYLEETERIKILVVPEVKKSGFHKLYFDFIKGKKIINELKPDYVISLQNIVTFGCRSKQAVFVHQAIPFQNIKNFSFIKPEERTYAFYQYIVGYFIKLSIKIADNVFVQTKWMKEAVIMQCNIPEDKIHVIHHEASFDSGYHYSLKENQFFFPAAFECVYKNQKCIYEAANILKGKGLTDFKIILTLEEKHQKVFGCEFVGLLNKSEVFEFYSNSILVFPSFIETVGLPLIEAMSVGALIFASDCEYSREILNGYKNVYFFDPFLPEQLAQLMELVMKGQIDLFQVEKTIANKKESWSILLEKLKFDLV